MAAKRHPSKPTAPPSPARSPRGIVARQAARIAELEGIVAEVKGECAILAKDRDNAEKQLGKRKRR